MKRSIFLVLLCLVSLITQAQQISFEVTPDTSLYHHPVKMLAKGFEPGEKVTFELEATDAANHQWQSWAEFEADVNGEVNPAYQPSVDGTYTGIHAMGLFWSMETEDYHQIATGSGFTANIKVLRKGKVVATQSIYRRSTRELEALGIQYIKKRDSIIADIYLPEGSEKLPAIIFLGGSGGHFRQERASLFASEGYAVLNLKYFRFEGLPDGIIEIPLEYVAKAHDWLKAHPRIDADNIGIMGRSMGSELALLYGAHYDGLSYVLAEAPSSVVWFGWQDGTSSFAYKGKGFPYAEYTDEDSERIQREIEAKGEQFQEAPKFLSAFKNEAMIEKASILVENIQCPVLFVSGKDDLTWPSTMMADRMMERLRRSHFKYPFKHLAYDEAGHNFAGGGQGCGIPYLPPEDYSNSSAKGGTDKGNALAAAQSWQAILDFIRPQ